MAMISKIGSKSWKVRGLYLGMYTFLVLGACTMVYPFLLMISGSTKSAVDIKYFNAVPRFLFDDAWLYRKHMEGLFNDSILYLDTAYDTDEVAFEDLELPAFGPAKASPAEGESRDLKPANMAEVEEAQAFVKNTDLPSYWYTVGYVYNPVTKTIPENLRKFKKWLQGKYGEDINDVNRALEAEFIDWNSCEYGLEQYLARREKPRANPYSKHQAEFKEQVPLGLRYYFSAEGYYKKMYLRSQYPRKSGKSSLEVYNEAHGTEYESWDQIHLARSLPTNPKEAKDWTVFVRDTLALHWIRVDSSAAPIYRDFLKAKHIDIANLNKNYGASYSSFDEIPLVHEPPIAGGLLLSDWEAFIIGWKDPDTGKIYQVPADALRIRSLETVYQDYLLDKYGELQAINLKLGTDYQDLKEIRFPQRDMHLAWFYDHRGDLKWEFVTRNYKAVGEYMLFHGRGIFNTVVYCALAVMSALLVNPLAAYAMSRFRMPSSYKILLFLLCTMAFPPMVTSIPNFLMLRQLGLLNTFAALILPGLANGYAIFLLKGFFDAQPQELYESAQLDGASEWVLFWQIAMSLSKPILAVIALQAFQAAYSNFMFAFVVCQDSKMWTLMVWLYQLQQRSGQAVMYASLIIAAIPTFLIFLFCQNIIMRGIVVPSEK